MTGNMESIKTGCDRAVTADTAHKSDYFTPQADIYETPEEVVLQCDIPGSKVNDINVKFEKGQLTLCAKVASRHSRFLRQEYGVGDFYRSFLIAPEIDSDKIAAEYREGVLTLHLPKREKAKPRQIAVKAG